MTDHLNIAASPDFCVYMLRHHEVDVFSQMCSSMLSYLLDLHDTALADLLSSYNNDKNRGNRKHQSRGFRHTKKGDSPVVFGSPLTQEGIAQAQLLIDFLSAHTNVEGIFRVPGNSIRVERLKECLNTGVDVDLEGGQFTPHDVASVLKMFLSELPEPLLTSNQYRAQLAASDLTYSLENQRKHASKENESDNTETKKPGLDNPDSENKENCIRDGSPLAPGGGVETIQQRWERKKAMQIKALQLMLLMLPYESATMLRQLLKLLYTVARNQDTNRMNAHNLATVFTPHILFPKNMSSENMKDDISHATYAVTFLIRHSQKLFNIPAELREHVSRYYTVKERSMKGLADDTDVSDALTVTPVLAARNDGIDPSVTQIHTREALQQLYAQIKQLPQSNKKKRLMKQIKKSEPECRTPERRERKHSRSRSFHGILKRKIGATPTLFTSAKKKPHGLGSTPGTFNKIHNPWFEEDPWAEHLRHAPRPGQTLTTTLMSPAVSSFSGAGSQLSLASASSSSGCCSNKESCQCRVYL